LFGSGSAFRAAKLALAATPYRDPQDSIETDSLRAKQPSEMCPFGTTHHRRFRGRPDLTSGSSLLALLVAVSDQGVDVVIVVAIAMNSDRRGKSWRELL